MTEQLQTVCIYTVSASTIHTAFGKLESFFMALLNHHAIHRRSIFKNCHYITLPFVCVTGRSSTIQHLLSHDHLPTQTLQTKYINIQSIVSWLYPCVNKIFLQQGISALPGTKVAFFHPCRRNLQHKYSTTKSFAYTIGEYERCLTSSNSCVLVTSYDGCISVGEIQIKSKQVNIWILTGFNLQLWCLFSTLFWGLTCLFETFQLQLFMSNRSDCSSAFNSPCLL